MRLVDFVQHPLHGRRDWTTRLRFPSTLIDDVLLCTLTRFLEHPRTTVQGKMTNYFPSRYKIQTSTSTKAVCNLDNSPVSAILESHDQVIGLLGRNASMRRSFRVMMMLELVLGVNVLMVIRHDRLSGIDGQETICLQLD